MGSSAAHEAGKSIRGVTAGALSRLVEQPWPGNVRQLEHEVRRLVLSCDDSEAIVTETLDLAGLTSSSAGGGMAATPPAPLDVFGSLRLGELERQAVAEALRRCNENQSRAAELLGITRMSLYRRMQRHGMT